MLVSAGVAVGNSMYYDVYWHIGGGVTGEAEPNQCLSDSGREEVQTGDESDY